MRRGTTPRYKIKLPFDIKTVVSDLRVTFEQENVEVLTKKLEDCTVDRDILSVWLTQEETLSFNANILVKVQVKILEHDGNVVSHQPRLESCKEILNEEILSDKSGIATLDLIEVDTFPEAPKDGKVYRTVIGGKTAIGIPNEDTLVYVLRGGNWTLL